MYVINSQGQKELFSRKKIYRSLVGAGASKILAREISEKIEKEAYEGIKTSEIAQKIKNYLQKESLKTAIRYNIKDGMLKLGPTGFYFEDYIKEIFSFLGYKTKKHLSLFGVSGVEYEIDLLAKKEEKFLLGECKYHQDPGLRVDLKVVLASYSRYLDLKNSSFFKKKNLICLLITNTKFTSQVIKFSNFYNISLLGWKYPKNKGLETLIEKNNLYPITLLPSFNSQLKEIFLAEKKILARDLLKLDIKKIAKKYNVSSNLFDPLLDELKILLGS